MSKLFRSFLAAALLVLLAFPAMGMQSVFRNFRVVPSVYPADKNCKVTVRALGENVEFTPGSEYTVRVYGINSTTYKFDRMVFDEYKVRPEKKNELKFDHFFKGEQEYIIKITRPDSDKILRYTPQSKMQRKPGNNEAVLHVYSLKEDLYGMKAWKGDTHSHTIGSDGMQDVYRTVGNYRAGGYDFMAITDHWTMEPSVEAVKIFKDAPVSMTLVRGEEVHHNPTMRTHNVNWGGTQSVNDYWKKYPDIVKKEVAKIMLSLDDLPEGIDKEDFAIRIWVARKIREFGGLAVLSHPHWLWNDVHFIPDDVTKELLRRGVYDCLELNNNSLNDETLCLWADMRAEGIRVPIVGASDSHDSDRTTMVKPIDCYCYVVAKDRTVEALMEGFKSERACAVDARENRLWVLGNYRIAEFVRFIAKYYDPIFQKLCEPQGFLLAEYYDKQDDTDKLLEMHNKRSDEFNREFYGY